MKTPTALLPGNGRPVRPEHALRLPDLPPVRETGTRLVHRAVTLTLLLLTGAGLLALLASLVVEIDISVEAQGVLEPVTVWPVRSQEAGMVSEMLVLPGDTVEAGQVLARLDPLPLQSQLDRLEGQAQTLQIAYRRAEASAALEAGRRGHARRRAEAQLIRARATLRAQLVQFGFRDDIDSVLTTYVVGSHVSVDQALADVMTATVAVEESETQEPVRHLEQLDLDHQQAELSQLTGQIRTLRERLDRLAIRAPTTGLVLTDHLERMLGIQVQQGERLLEIAELDAWHVNLYVHERDVHEVQIGDTTKLEIIAFRVEKSDLFYGRVTSVGADGLNGDATLGASSSGLYRVTVVLDANEVARIGPAKLRRGYSVEGKIITQSGRIIELVWRHLKKQSTL